MRVSQLLLAGLAALLILFTLWWAGSGSLLADFGGDNAIYFLTANHYSPYGASHAAAAEFAARSVYPPLYAWLLAVSGGGTSLAAAHFVTALIIVFAGGAVYGLARALDCSRGMAMAVLVACAFARISLLEGLEIHSEHLYLACWASAAWLLARDQHRARDLLLAGLAIAAAYLTRSFGLSLAASLLLWLLIKRPPRAWLAALPVVLAALYLALAHGGNARYVQDFIGLYQAHGIGARLGANLAAVPGAWLGVFGVQGQAGFQPALPALLAAAAFIGLVMRLRVAAFDALAVLAYVALMILWPYPAEYERMCYPLLPFALLHALHGARALAPRGHRQLVAALPLLLMFAAIAPYALLVQARLAAPPAETALRPYLRSSAWFDPDPATAFASLAYQRAITEALFDIARTGRIPPGQCLLATKPSVVALYSGLSVDGFPPFALADEATRAKLAAGRCHYLFVMMGASPSYPQFYYPYARLKPWLDVLEIYPNPVLPDKPAALLARLRDGVVAP